jgi:hypothetical protein
MCDTDVVSVQDEQLRITRMPEPLGERARLGGQRGRNEQAGKD